MLKIVYKSHLNEFKTKMSVFCHLLLTFAKHNKMI